MKTFSQWYHQYYYFSDNFLKIIRIQTFSVLSFLRLFPHHLLSLSFIGGFSQNCSARNLLSVHSFIGWFSQNRSDQNLLSPIIVGLNLSHCHISPHHSHANLISPHHSHANLTGWLLRFSVPGVCLVADLGVFGSCLRTKSTNNFLSLSSISCNNKIIRLFDSILGCPL